MRSKQILIDTASDLNAVCLCCLGRFEDDKGVQRCLRRGERKILGDIKAPRHCPKYTDERGMSVKDVKQAVGGCIGSRSNRQVSPDAKVHSHT